MKDAKAKGYGIVTEELKNIRESINARTKAYNSYNGKVQAISKHSRQMKRRLNAWPFGRAISMLGYKARWECVRFEKDMHRGNSRTCSVCGYYAKDLNEHKALYCPRCKISIDRHLNACVNMQKHLTSDGSLWFGLYRLPNVAMKRPLTSGFHQSHNEDKALSKRKEVNSISHKS